MTPRPRERRQAARRCDSLKMSTRIMGIRLERTKPRSICTLVNMMNQRLRWPALSSPVLSAQATLPAGYSPLLILLAFAFVSPFHWERVWVGVTYPIPMPIKNLYAASAASIPSKLPPAPYDPAERAANRIRMMVLAMSAHFRE